MIRGIIFEFLGDKGSESHCNQLENDASNTNGPAVNMSTAHIFLDDHSPKN